MAKHECFLTWGAFIPYFDDLYMHLPHQTHYLSSIKSDRLLLCQNAQCFFFIPFYNVHTMCSLIQPNGVVTVCVCVCLHVLVCERVCCSLETLKGVCVCICCVHFCVFQYIMCRVAVCSRLSTFIFLFKMTQMVILFHD